MKKFLFFILFPFLGFSQNTTLGQDAGTTIGTECTYIGYQVSFSANSNVEARSKSGNTFVGSEAGKYHSSEYSVYLGRKAGYNAVGNKNVLIGNEVGYSLTGDDKLFIDNSNTTEPLIWGDFALNQLKFNGAVSIATQLTPAGYKLAVGGKIIAEELKIQLQGQWPDYVFYSDYKLPNLQEVEKQIKEKGHLKDVPSAQEVKENGIQVGDMARIQQQKIEELTLYIIELNKKLEAQDKKLEDLETKMNNNLITK